MPGFKTASVATVALSFFALIAVDAAALAQSPKKPVKISYAEAFKRCKAFIDKEKGGLANSTTNELNRTSRGRACMQKFGHRL